MGYPEKGFISSQPSEDQKNSLITGSGTMGLTIPGKVSQDMILLSHERLYIPYHKPMPAPPLKDHLDKLRTWVYNNQGGEALKFAWEMGQEMGYPEIWWVDAFIPACYLVVQADQEGQPDNYARSTDWETGVTTIAWKQDKHVFHRKMFAARPVHVSVLSIESPTKAKINSIFKHQKLGFGSKKGIIQREQAFYNERVKLADPGVDKEWLTFKARFKLDWPTSMKGYNVVSKIIPFGGRLESTDEMIKVTGADKILVLTYIKPFYDTPQESFSKQKQYINNIPADFNKLLNSHTKIHKEIFNRVDFKLGPGNEKQLTSEELIDSSSIGSLNNALVEKLFYAARFGIVCSTGERPPNLQGVWGTRWRAPWCGDFTQDGNVQSAIGAGLSGNHFEVMRCYLDYMSSMMDDFKANARDLYGMQGIWVPSKTSTHGKVYHFRYRDDKPPYGFPGVFWIAGAAWTSRFYYDYWLYTGDHTFLKQQAIPFMLESAYFYEDYLKYEKNNKIVVNPSYAPEIVPLDFKYNLVPNATMDVAAIKELLRNLLALHEEELLEVTFDRIKKWKYILAKLPVYQVGKDGAFKEWLWPGAENNDEHRHCSHLYPLYYDLDPDIAASDKLLKACTRAVQNRLDFRKRIKGSSMAYGLSLLGTAAAHIKNSDQAYQCVDILANRYWSRALASSHNPKGDVNMDISGGYPQLIIEMLMYSQKDVLELLPALPKQWPDGSISGLRAKGGFKVDILWENNKLKSAVFTSLLGNPLKVKYKDKIYNLNIIKGSSYTLIP